MYIGNNNNQQVAGAVEGVNLARALAMRIIAEAKIKDSETVQTVIRLCELYLPSMARRREIEANLAGAK